MRLENGIRHTVVTITGIDVVSKMVAVEAGKITVVVLASRVEMDKTVVVCPSAVVVAVTVKDDAGMMLVIVDTGTSDSDVLVETRVVVVKTSAAELEDPISSPASWFESNRMAEKAGSSESICPLTSE